MSAKDEYGGDLPVTSGSSTRYPARACSHCPAAFFSEENHHAHMLERHSDKPVAEAWESSPEHTVTYYPNVNRHTPHMYVLSDTKSGKYLSNMVIGHEGSVEGLETHPEHRREGLASELWHSANQHAEGTPGVPTPKHSSLRTGAGEKWAKKVGGEVPKRQGALLSPRQMQGMVNFE